MSKQIEDWELKEIADAIVNGHPTTSCPAEEDVRPDREIIPGSLEHRVKDELSHFRAAADAYQQAMTDLGQAVADFYGVAITGEADNSCNLWLIGFKPAAPEQEIPLILDEYDEEGDWE